MKTRLYHLLLSLLLACMLFVFCAVNVYADDWGSEETLTTVVDTEGQALFTFSGLVSVDDEYISAENVLYRVSTVTGRTAVAERIGEEPMPDISWLSAGQAQPVFAAFPAAASDNKETEQKKLIAMYVTHSDESYIPTDGTQSINGQGGIYDVARDFRDSLQALGIDVILDESTHLPHDAGAYRRSRQTAERLLQKQPDAIIDIHRDGIPNQNEYTTTLNGKNASQVRLLVGRGNQNSASNREFAKEIKAIADKQVPGLIKDIFIGKGNYNQDLSPNAILLEFGTHTLSKERVLNSTESMAKVLSTALYGAETGSAQSQVSVSQKQKNANRASASMTGIGAMLALVVVGLLVFALAQTGTMGGMKKKLGRGVSEMTGGLFGDKPSDKNS